MAATLIHGLPTVNQLPLADNAIRMWLNALHINYSSHGQYEAIALDSSLTWNCDFM